MAIRQLRIALICVVAAAWLALGRLALAFWNSELDWATVASYSRRDAPWYYRVAAVWGGLEGSLLLFIAILGLCSVLVAWRLRSAASVGYALGAVVALGLIELTLANPFRTLAVPAVGGFGLTPILEHPAMAVHPPILYTGLAATMVVFLFAIDGHPGPSRTWLRWSLALITLAMALGAIWSYVEQGWGGYWAWDPVENTSLLVWLAVLIALHAQSRWQVGGSRLPLALPWLLTLMGACIVRSGSTPSIHGFGQRAAMGWWLLALLATTIVVVLGVDRRAGRGEATRQPRPPLGATAMNVRVAALIGLIVIVGTLAPVVIDLFADRPAAVRGRFYSAFVGPAALVGAVFVARRLRHVGARGWLAHLGMLVLLIGIGASTFDRTESIRIGAGQTVAAAGVTVTNVAVRTEPGPRIESDAVVATVRVGGRMLEPARVAFRDRGGQLAENAVISRPWRDIQVQLDSANDAGVLGLTIYNRPLMWLIWLGAVIVVAGAGLSPLRRRIEGECTLEPGSARSCTQAARATTASAPDVDVVVGTNPMRPEAQLLISATVRSAAALVARVWSNVTRRASSRTAAVTTSSSLPRTPSRRTSA